ncbi:MAG: ABC transporter permease [Chitinophagaceae bacterium]
MLKNYIKNAWRNIGRNKTTSCIKIAGLSVGMTAAVLIFLWVQNETSFDNYRDKKNIFRLTTLAPGWGAWETTPLLLAAAIKTELPEIEKTTRLYTNNWPVFSVKGNLFYEKECAYVDQDWFTIFDYNFIEGNAASFNEYPFSIVLSKSEASKYFGSSKALGQTIRVDSMDYHVRGVVADAAVNSSFQYKAFIPIAALLTNLQIRQNDEQWNNANYITFIKTIAGINPTATAAKISAILKTKANAGDATPIGMISLAEMHFETAIQNSAFIHGNRNTVYIFSLLGFLLLLIACINYVNLTTAKASLRAKEVSIRKITGANRAHLFFQFLTESVLISLLSLLATLLLVQLCLPAFNQLTGKFFTLPVLSLSLWKVMGITLSVALLLNSIYPAVLLSSFKPLQVFRGATVLKIKDSSFRKLLVVVQFTISVILIAGTIIIYKQMQFIQQTDPGYNRSQVLSFALPPVISRENRPSVIQAMKAELILQSGIDAVASANQPVVNIGSSCTECADWEGHDSSYKPRIAQLSADVDFQKTMQLQMREGRWFSLEDGIRHGFILNEAAVTDFKLKLPAVGQTFIFKGDTGRVIGVVKDFAYKSLHEKMGPVVIFNNPAWRNQLVVRTAPKNAGAALLVIQKIWKKYIPQSPLEYTFLEDSFNNLYKQDQLASLLILVFAIIAIVISASGLFSLAAFEAAQRTKEIGIRKVLGATVTSITALLSKEFIQLVGIAILIASPLTLWMMRKWLEAFAYRISISWWMFALAGALALFIALLTTSLQAIKAAMTNPVKSLRSE